MAKGIQRMVMYDGREYTLTQLAATFNLTLQTFWSRWDKAGQPYIIPVDSKMLAPARGSGAPPITINGVQMSMLEASRRYQVSVTLIQSRVRKFGPKLTVDHLKKYSMHSSRKTYRPCRAGQNTPEEKAKLARIPNGTRLEYEIRGLVPPC